MRQARRNPLTDVMQTPLYWLDEPRSAWPAQLPDALRAEHPDIPWSQPVRLRNRIVHDYLNVDMTIVETLVKERKYQLQVQFLLNPITP